MLNSSITILKVGGIIGASLLSVLALSEASEAYSAAKEEAARDIVNNRTEAERDVFTRLESIKATVNDILASEARKNTEMESEIIKRMNAAKAKCQFIFDREKAAFDREREDLVMSYEASKTIKEGVLAREKESLAQRLRDDKKYQAFKTSKKAFESSGLSTAEMDEALEKRKKHILSEIIGERTEVEKTAFLDVDTLKGRLSDFDRGRMTELRKERTPEESALVHEFDSIKGDLKRKDRRMEQIASARTADQRKAFDDLHRVEADAQAILDREASGVNGTEAFARYLAKKKIPKAIVFAVGSVPMIPVVYISYRYISWLIAFINKMEV